MDKTKFHRVEDLIQLRADAGWSLDDFGELEGSYWLHLPQKACEPNVDYGRRKAQATKKAKAEMRGAGAEPLWHEWDGCHLQICAVVYQ